MTDRWRRVKWNEEANKDWNKSTNSRWIRYWTNVGGIFVWIKIKKSKHEAMRCKDVKCTGIFIWLDAIHNVCSYTFRYFYHFNDFFWTSWVKVAMLAKEMEKREKNWRRIQILKTTKTTYVFQILLNCVCVADFWLWPFEMRYTHSFKNG